MIENRLIFLKEKIVIKSIIELICRIVYKHDYKYFFSKPCNEKKHYQFSMRFSSMEKNNMYLHIL